MSNGFLKNGIRQTNNHFDLSLIQSLKNDWMAYLNKIPMYPDNFTGKGIVICAGGLNYFTCAWVNINILRQTGCKLPIEVWYRENELPSEIINQLKKLNVDCKNFSDYSESQASGYMLKPLSIILSRFKEVLFLDADNICVKDPTELFESEEYKKFGAVFWPDYWKTCSRNPIWKIIDIKPFFSREQESGQILINKEKCWKPINLCYFFNMENHFYYQILLGDKDTFKFAWLALKERFAWINKEPSCCGYVLNEKFFGITMVQHGFDNEVLFLHRNLLKWFDTPSTVDVWHKIKRFRFNADIREYLFDRSVYGHYYMDLNGDVDTLDFCEVFGDLEMNCLKILNDLRSSETYKNFIKLQIG